MAIYRGPNIVRDGLLVALDAANPKSYPGSGTTWYDLSGNGYNGTLVNGPTFNSSVKGNIAFDGVNDRVDISNPGYPNNGTDAFTLSITFMIPTGATWYNQGSGTGIIGRNSYAGSLGIFRNSTEGGVSFWARLDGGNIYNPSVSGLDRDVYHNIVGTFNGVDTAQIYHNGLYIAQEVSANNSGTFDNNVYSLGGNIAFGGNNGLYGQVNIPDVKIYNRALTSAEILQNYNATKSRYQ